MNVRHASTFPPPPSSNYLVNLIERKLHLWLIAKIISSHSLSTNLLNVFLNGIIQAQIEGNSHQARDKSAIQITHPLIPLPPAA
jgi:hypothetical protein